MCTVIYIPSKEGPLFSSCRDEDPAREAALQAQIINANTGLLLYPQDAAAKGTWAGLHEQGHVVILLNGAFINHERKNNYRKSRGLIVRDLLDTLDPLAKWDAIDLKNIEPFTLVVWVSRQLFEWIWDGNHKHEKKMDAEKPHIWSSVTLYGPPAQALRKSWFAKALMQNSIVSAEQLLQLLHLHNDPLNGFVMSRNKNIQTLSISLIQLHPGYFVFRYQDINNKTDSNHWLKHTAQLQKI